VEYFLVRLKGIERRRKGEKYCFNEQ